jgi:tetratricopeptide (TPR) repeat protein
VEKERYQRIKRLVMEADALPVERRGAFLDAACGDDDGLRAEVERLLRPATVATYEVSPRERAAGELEPTVGVRAAPSPGERIGSYQIGEELGRGGMGVVCAAVDTRDGREVALKLVYPDLLGNPGVRERFAREAQLGARVVHENVVRTHEKVVWEHEGVQHEVLVMERVRGRNLRERLAEWDRLPEGLVREIAHEVAAGLDAIHGAGIVHRDLKPENVLLTDDQRVRIMDLGIAKVLETTIELTLEGHFIGSVAYAAPEQLESREIGPPCDLYALGVVLYELLTGENPFRRPELGASVAAHLGARPPSVATRVPGVSPFLSDVVDVLLARQPADRFASASELLRVLEEDEAGDWWQAREDARPHAPGAPLVPVDRATALHGRASDVEALRTAWRTARDGEGRVLLVEGEPGIGKTRLLDAFVADVAAGPGRILYGAFPAAGGPRGLTEAVEGALGHGAVAEEVAALLGESDPDAGHLGLLRREPEAIDAIPLSEGALTSVCCSVLRRLAAEGPVLWIVDDLHHASESALAAALAMARLAPSLPVLLVLATRETVPPEVHQELQRVPAFARRTLARLSAKEVIDLLEDAVGSEVLADRLGARIARKSDGVPFFVFEMLRALRDAGCLTQDADGAYVLTRSITDVEVPSAIRDLVAARLDEVTREERETLDVAAVAGGEFDAGVLADVLGRPLVRVLQDLAELERRRRIVRSVGRGHRFDHEQFRDVLYEELPDALRAEYHAMLADAHAARGGPEIDGRLADILARHHLQGSRPAAGLPHLEPALVHLEECHRNVDAADLAELALSHGRLLDDRQRVRLHLRAAGHHDLLGHRDEQLTHAQEALELATPLGDAGLLASVHRTLASHAFALHDMHESIAQLNKALELSREAGDERAIVDTEIRLAGSIALTHDHEAAHAVLDEAREAAAALGDPGREGEALRVTANLLTHQFRYQEAEELIQRAWPLLEQAGDLRSAATAHSLRGSLAWYQGRVDDAIDGFTRCLEIGRQVGDRRLEVNSRGRLGLTSMHAGRLADALRQFRHHRDGGVETGDAAGVGQAHCNLAQTHALLGSYERALDNALRARDVARVIDGRRMEAFAATQVATTLRLRGRLDEAREHAQSAEEVAQSINDATLAAQAVMERAAIHEAAGDKTAAIALLRDVEARAQAADSERLHDAATVALSRLGVGDAGDAWRRYEEHEAGLAVHQRLQARHNLWKASGERRHLAVAHELLLHLSKHAPPDRRDAMIDDVEIYREIVDAFAVAE